MRRANSWGPSAQKVLLLLLGGASLILSHSLRQQFRIIKSMGKEWEEIERKALYRAIKNLYRSKLIDGKYNPDGTTTLRLTENGKQKSLTYHLDTIRISPMKKWDGKWRIVLFDIPEKYKKGRDALSQLLKNMGFYKFQKSVFVHPFECQNEIDFVVEFFSLRPFVRMIIAEKIDNELHLKKHFNLS